MNRIKNNKSKFKVLLFAIATALLFSGAAQSSLAMQGKDKLENQTNEININTASNQNTPGSGNLLQENEGNNIITNNAIQNPIDEGVNEFEISTVSTQNAPFNIGLLQENENSSNQSSQNKIGQNQVDISTTNVDNTENNNQTNEIEINTSSNKNNEIEISTVSTQNAPINIGLLQENENLSNQSSQNKIGQNQVDISTTNVDNTENNNQTKETNINTAGNQTTPGNGNLLQENEGSNIITNNAIQNPIDEDVNEIEINTSSNKNMIDNNNPNITINFEQPGQDQNEIIINDENEIANFTNQALDKTISQATDSDIINACTRAGLSFKDADFLITLVKYLKIFRILKKELINIFDSKFNFAPGDFMNETLQKKINDIFKNINNQVPMAFVENDDFKFRVNDDDDFKKALSKVYATLWDYLKQDYKSKNVVEHRRRVNIFISGLIQEMEPSLREDTENYKIYKNMFSNLIKIIFDEIENMSVDAVVSEYKTSGLSDALKEFEEKLSDAFKKAKKVYEVSENFRSSYIDKRELEYQFYAHYKWFKPKITEFIKNVYYRAVNLAGEKGKVSEILKQVPKSKLNDTKKWLENILTEKAKVLFFDIFKHKDYNADSKNNYEQFCSDVKFLCDEIYKEVARLSLLDFIDLFGNNDLFMKELFELLKKEKRLVDETYVMFSELVLPKKKVKDINTLIKEHQDLIKSGKENDILMDKNKYKKKVYSRGEWRKHKRSDFIRNVLHNGCYRVERSNVKNILQNCVDDGDDTTNEFLNQISFNEDRLRKEFDSTDERHRWAWKYRGELSEIFLYLSGKLCDYGLYKLKDDFSFDTINSNEINKDELAKKWNNYNENCEQLKKLFTDKNGGVQQGDLSGYEYFMRFFNTVTGFIAGRDVYKAFCKVDKDFILNAWSSFKQKLKNEFIEEVNKIRKVYKNQSYTTVNQLKKAIQEAVTDVMKKKFGINFEEEVASSETGLYDIYDLDLDLDYYAEKFLLLYSYVYSKNVYSEKFNQFVFYVVEQAIKKYCNSTDDLQIENLLSKLIKVMAGSSSSPFFKKMIHTLENDEKLNEIFKEMFKWAYEVKSIKFVNGRHEYYDYLSEPWLDY